MPSTESIERIHEQLTPLGDEPRVAAERGEIIEPPPRPEETLDDDLSSLLDDVDSDSEEISQEQAAEGQDTSELLANLDSLFDEDDEEDADVGPGEESEDVGHIDDLDTGIDFGDEDFPAPPDFSFDPEEIPDEPPADQEPPSSTEAEPEP
ncbi:MAG: periplasmic-type flagellar collar protein FlcA, partial [Alkalispirochaeta sp.]